MRDIPSYDPASLEAKWQARWAERHTNEPDLDRAARPFYNLMMFPYPSAEGLHVGNMFAFTGADIYGRFNRHQSGEADSEEHHHVSPPAAPVRGHVRLAARAFDHRSRLLQVDPVALSP